MYGYRTGYMLTHPHKMIWRTCREIRWAWQRVVRGWDDTVWWSLDSFLCPIIIHTLTKLKEDGHGYPAELTVEKWGEVLAEMIDGFKAAEEIQNDTESFPVWQERDAAWKKLHGDDSWTSFEKIGDSKFSQMVTHPDMKQIEEYLNFWDRHNEEYEAAMERYRRGMDLFKEYFFGLWD